MPKHKLGWRPDTPDIRDHMYRVEEHIDFATLPPLVDLRKALAFSPFSQLELGSCTAQCIAAHLGFNRKKQNLNMFVPSRLFIYYNERSMEGTIKEDAGAELRSGIKTIARQGYCPEDDWPHDISCFTVRPSAKAYANAMLYRAIKYARVRQSVNQMRGCLAEGFPFVGGISIYESFDSEEVAEHGIIPMPKTSEAMLGGHAVMFLGYNDPERKYIGLNSWGSDWGDSGLFHIPYDYLHNPDLAADFWTIRLVV